MKRAEAGGSTSTPTDVDEYLATLPRPFRTALERLRRTIRSAAPEATEAISYRVPTFKYRGSGIVAFAAFENHCSLFVMSSSLLDGFGGQLARYETSKGTIRFSPDRPLPDSLIRRLVRARVAEKDAASEGRRGSAQRSRTGQSAAASRRQSIPRRGK